MLVNFGFLFRVAGPVVLTEQSAYPVGLQEAHEVLKLVVHAPWRLVLVLTQKGAELEQIFAFDVVEKELWAGSAEVVQRRPIRGDTVAAMQQLEKVVSFSDRSQAQA